MTNKRIFAEDQLGTLIFNQVLLVMRNQMPQSPMR
jgi:hypothetical protein